MSVKNKLGFTIIETMLFLAISGMLIVALLANTGSSVNIQRYHDSVQSLQGMLQDQYSEVINVRNETPIRPISCDTNAVISDSGPNPTTNRGQGDCVLLGRYVSTSTPDSKTLTTSSVVGRIKNPDLSSSSDVVALQNYYLNVVPSTLETYDIEWGAALQPVNSNAAMPFSILVLRSPSSGFIKTFVNSTQSLGSAEISDLVTPGNLNQELKMCVDAGGLFGTKKMAVVIVAGATSASGVETLGDASSGC